MARKPEIYDGETSIDDWVDSMKAYIEGTNPGVVMDQVRVSHIKLFMGPTALRMVKHYLKEEFCDWVALKKCLETVFTRHTLKYSTLEANFLLREQKSDESFSSFFNNLWTLCDEMNAMKPKRDQDNETKVIIQFTQNVHNIIVRNSLKQYLNAHGDNDDFISRHIFDAAKYYAKDHGVEDQYYKSYDDAAMLLKQGQAPNTKVNISNVNTLEKPFEGKPISLDGSNKNSEKTRSNTPEQNRPYQRESYNAY